MTEIEGSVLDVGFPGHGESPVGAGRQSPSDLRKIPIGADFCSVNEEPRAESYRQGGKSPARRGRRCRPPEAGRQGPSRCGPGDHGSPGNRKSQKNTDP